MPYVSDEKQLLIYVTSIGGASYLWYEYGIPMMEKDTGEKASGLTVVAGTLGIGAFFGVIVGGSLITVMEG